MGKITVNSTQWEVRRTGATRGAGDQDAGPLPGLPRAFLTEGTTVEDEVVLQPRPAARGEAPPSTLDLEVDVGPGESAVLALRLPSGALIFQPPSQIVATRARGGPTVHFTVPAHLAMPGPASRGLVDKAIKAIVVKVKELVIDKAVELALPKLAEAFEILTWRHQGLKEGWLKVTGPTLKAKALTAGRPTSTDRSLLFIHGTFSNAAAAFSSLAEKSDFFSKAAAIYGERIFAFDHFTLSKTPEQNAKELLEGLTDKTFTFDVITHSRGGLVLRNLVERTDALGRESKRFRLGQVVLVASPNEGTPLATPRRFEDTIGWIANLLELFPDNPFTTGPAFVANGIVWLAKHITGDLPGLSAMDGDGRMIQTLQEPPGPPADRYSALVANCNPSANILQRLIDVGLDQFFGSANDLVVPSEGGWRIDRSGSKFIPGSRIGCFGPGGNLPGDAVTHVNIFDQPGAAPFLLRALASQAQTLLPMDPAQGLPDRRLIRARAAGVASPGIRPGGTPAAARRARMTGTRARVTREPASQAVFSLTVVNGDLSFESRPLLVGHYRSTVLTGTEAFIDRMTQKAMSRSLDLGVYPGEPGTHQIFLNTFLDKTRGWKTPRPKAVIVVGLGQEGALRPGQISQSVRRAIIAWAQRSAEKGRPDEPLELASTLMGSGGSGVTAAQAAVLIARGVFEANQLLVRSKSTLPVVRDLRLIELYTDRAAEAWRALRMQDEATPGRFKLVEPIATGTGPLLRPLDSGYRGAAYDFVEATTKINTNGESEIQFALDTKRARTEVRAQVTQVRLLRNLVKEASSAQNADATIGGTLYKLLVPVEFEAFLSSSGETQIVLDDTTAGIPWELLDDDTRGGGDERPWGIRAKLLRKFKTEEFREHVVDADARAPMLVIGEPASPVEYPPLPGAYKEASAVYDCLSQAGPALSEEVFRLMAENEGGPGPVARTVVGKLLEKNWRVVHIAGHGALPDANGGPGGVVLSDGTFLGPQEIEAMRVVPELVFVNCCHLGAFPYDRVRFASGVARKLIDIGVRCVVAAGWAVDDDAAQAFAETFYKALLQNERFIDAVARARDAAFEFDGNTWAAYQCYGDPDWRLTKSAAWAGRKAAADEFNEIATIAGLKLALRTLIAQSTYQQYDDDLQRERLTHLEARFRSMKWRVADGIGELFAEAYAAADDIDQAIRWYDVVLEGSDGHFSLRAYEQRINLSARRAWMRVEKAADELAAATPVQSGRRRKGEAAATVRRIAGLRKKLQAETGRARRRIQAELRRLDRLDAFGDTAERENLRGSAMKRLAMVEQVAKAAAAERRAIDAMRKYYQRALDMQREVKGDLFYPAMNLIVAHLAQGQRPEKSLFQAARKSLLEKEAENADFWSVVGETELRLYDAIARHGLARGKRAIIESYDDVAKRVRGGSSWGSVRDTATFLLSNYTRRARGKEADAGTKILAYLKTRTPTASTA